MPNICKVLIDKKQDKVIALKLLIINKQTFNHKQINI